MSNNNNQLTPANTQENGGIIATVNAKMESWGVDLPSLEYVTSLDARKPREAALLALHLGDDGLKPEDFINRDIKIQHVTIFPIRWADEESGEEKRTLSVVLQLEDGERIQFRSHGILKSLAIAHVVRGAPPWLPALEATLLRRSYSNGHSGYQLRLKLDIEPEKAKGKK